MLSDHQAEANGCGLATLDVGRFDPSMQCIGAWGGAVKLLDGCESAYKLGRSISGLIWDLVVVVEPAKTVGRT